MSLRPLLRSLGALAAAVILPSVIGAQEPAAARPALTRMSWDLANAIAFADSSTGTHLMVAATQHATKSGLEFYATFDPAAVEEWTNRLATVLAESGPPAEGATYLMAVLRGHGGDQVIAARPRDGKKWAKDFLVNFRPARGEGFTVKLRRQQVERLGTALLLASAQSAIGAMDLREPDVPVITASDVVAAPRILTDASPRYPSTLADRRTTGEVWATFKVDASGRAVPETLEVLLADHRAFVAAVRESLPYVIFQPATVNGRAVAQRVHRRFVFALDRFEP